MKNLLFVTQYYPPEIGAGATRAEATVKYLSGKGWNVDVLTETANYPMGEPFETGYDSQQPENVEIERTWVWMNKRETNIKKIIFFLSFAISSFLRIIQKPFRYDVLLVSSPPIFYAFTTIIAARIMNIPIVVEIRDLWPDAAFQTEQSHQTVWYKVGKKLELWMYKKASHIIAVTRASAEIIEEVTETPVTVVENGVDCERFRPVKKNEIKLDEPISSDRFRVGFIGSLGVIHDFRTLMQAAKICEKDPQIEFIVIGDGSKHYEFQELISQYQPENLKWFGLKTHDKVPHYISSFDIGLNPINDAEVFESIVTVKFYEMLACGVPVISAARGAMEEISSKCEAAIVVPPGDPEEMAAQILSMKSNAQQLPELGEKARRYIHENYNRQKLSARLEQVLQTTLVSG